MALPKVLRFSGQSHFFRNAVAVASISPKSHTKRTDIALTLSGANLMLELSMWQRHRANDAQLSMIVDSRPALHSSLDQDKVLESQRRMQDDIIELSRLVRLLLEDRYRIGPRFSSAPVAEPESSQTVQTPNPVVTTRSYGLSTAMTSIRSRADGFRSLNIVLSSELATKAFSTSFLSSTFGGQNRRRERVTTASYSSMTGYKDFLYLKHAHQPFAPLQPGEPGILLTTAQRGDSWPEYEKVLVSMPPGALVCKFVYAGEYELRGGAPLTAEELCSLHPEVILHWARHILKSSAAHCMTMRARVWFRKEKGREPTPQQIENMVNHTHGVTISDIVTALKQGKEQLFAWGMLPAWYEPCFQRLLLSVEEGQEEMAVTGRLLQVRTSRRARVVTDKAKMVPTARHRKRRREIDSDADDIEVIE